MSPLQCHMVQNSPCWRASCTLGHPNIATLSSQTDFPNLAYTDWKINYNLSNQISTSVLRIPARVMKTLNVAIATVLSSAFVNKDSLEMVLLVMVSIIFCKGHI